MDKYEFSRFYKRVDKFVDDYASLYIRLSNLGYIDNKNMSIIENAYEAFDDIVTSIAIELDDWDYSHKE